MGEDVAVSCSPFPLESSKVHTPPPPAEVSACAASELAVAPAEPGRS